jgi:deazaflavin-dependent oxidoreductase (nitroreductase family)
MPATKPDPRFVRVLASLHRTLFRWSGGRLLAGYKGEPMIMLTTKGRRTGEPRTWPLTGLRLGGAAGDEGRGGWAVAASNGGHDHHPAWYLNLVAHPEATVQDGRRTVAVRARDTEGAERGELWARFTAYLANYTAYEQATDRVIPVVVLEPVEPVEPVEPPGADR